MIELTIVAEDIATKKQLLTIIGLANNAAKVVVQAGGFDLPIGYLGVRIEYANGRSIYGGVDSEGILST